MSDILEKVVKKGEYNLEEVLVRAIMRPITALKLRVDTLASKIENIASKAQEMPLQGIQGVKGDKGDAGIDGKPGKDGKNGVNGRDGLNGKNGLNGKEGVDGKNGVSVIDAEVTFDNHLVITLSNGNEIDAGEIYISNEKQIVQMTQVRGAEETVVYTSRYDQVTTELAYKGEALVGSLDATPVWRIQKLVFNAEGDVTITWANGNADFRYVWNDRASLTFR